jgi:hypothetical protein
MTEEVSARWPAHEIITLARPDIKQDGTWANKRRPVAFCAMPLREDCLDVFLLSSPRLTANLNRAFCFDNVRRLWLHCL